MTPSSPAISAPQRLKPNCLPEPWLIDTESLLSELARVRGLALNIPAVRNDILGPINSVITPCGIWKNGSVIVSICTAMLNAGSRKDMLTNRREQNPYLYMSSEQITQEAATTTQTRKR